VRSVHCSDLRGFGQGVYTEPLTGLVRLVPSSTNENWLDKCEPLSSFAKQEKYWEEIKRAKESVTTTSKGLLATTSNRPDGYLMDLSQNTGSIALNLNNLAIAVILSDVPGDKLVWALESKFNLFPDEGFSVNVRAITDELRRYKHWFAIQWDNIWISISLSGTVHVARYDRANMAKKPVEVDTFQIGSAGDFCNRDGIFTFIPLPGYGLSMSYSTYGGDNAHYLSSSNAATPVGQHLIKWPGKADTTTSKFVHFRASKWRLALNPMFHHVYGLHRIRYDAKGEGLTNTNTYPFGVGRYIADIFDPKYKPTNNPLDVRGLTVPDGHGASLGVVGAPPATYDGYVAPSLLNGDATLPWQAGVDRQGRVALTLATANPVYSPQVLGTHLVFGPVRNTRNTIPLIIGPCVDNGFDVLHTLTFSEDDQLRFEGHAAVRISSPLGKRICERGDATFQVEASYNNGVSWEIVFGGIAALDGQVKVKCDSSGIYYLASWTLKDQWERFKETPQTLDTAFDRMNLVEGINTVLLAVGEPPLLNAPASLLTVTIPPVPAGQHWRFGTRPGDTGDTIIKNFLLFARKQWEEWALRYNWAAQGWNLDLKPRDASPANSWIFTQFSDEVGPNVALLLGNGESGHLFEFDALPPGANYLQPVGLSSSDVSSAKRVPGAPLRNLASLTDQSSPDFLGRTKLMQAVFAPLSSLDEINKMGRRVYEYACHRRITLTVTSRWYTTLSPATHIAGIHLASSTGGREYPLTDLWVKRRTVRVDYLEKAGKVFVDYQLSNQWESVPD
jgi:hypothetical protein